MPCGYSFTISGKILAGFKPELLLDLYPEQEKPRGSHTGLSRKAWLGVVGIERSLCTEDIFEVEPPRSTVSIALPPGCWT